QVTCEAVSVANRMELEERSDAGVWFAQILVNRAKAHLLLGDASSGLDDSTRAARIYAAEIGRGATQLEGQRADVLFHRAEAHFPLGAMQDFSIDLRESVEISSRWIRDWVGECSIGHVFLLHASNVLSYLPAGYNTEVRLVLECVLGLHEALSGLLN